jgi:hypothetical protein
MAGESGAHAAKGRARTCAPGGHCKTYATAGGIDSLAPSLHRRQSFIDMERDMNEKNQGEGNREADRRYRQGVRETVHDTTEEERAKRARELTPEEREEAERAEREGRERKRSNASEREI